MAKLIGIEQSGNFGEDFFVAKAKDYLDDSFVIYRNRQLYGKEFDVCILMPDKGILVVELKGWREETVVRAEAPDTIFISTEDGEVSATPQKQARGYRFSMERHLKDNIGKFPLVFSMVCFPQISKQFFHDQRLNVILEERFTFLKEDMADKSSFFAKLNEAICEVQHWKRDPFDAKLMYEARSLFETNLEELTTEAETEDESFAYHCHDYSRFYFFAPSDPEFERSVPDIVYQYSIGCKLYCVFSTQDQMDKMVDGLKKLLTTKNIRAKRNSLEVVFSDEVSETDGIGSTKGNFQIFNCSFSVLSNSQGVESSSFMVINGQATESQLGVMQELSARSSFNLDQYRVEHAPVDKNIVIRAGAGTGKTYAMISRIAFLCYSLKKPLQQVSERITMITFTNEAADQMEERLKQYFRNYYILTSEKDYLNMISYIDGMQISTIHSYAKNIIAKLGTAFGYGVDLGIVSSEYARRKKISDLLDNYIRQKERTEGKGYIDSLGMPVYAIRDNVLSFIQKLHNKSVDISSIQSEEFGQLQDLIRGPLHDLLAYLIPAVEQEYAQELLDANRIHLSSLMSVLKKYVSAPGNRERLQELKGFKEAPQYLFVDEFQDTDDVQIETLLQLTKALKYKLFVVGDIKQCIYRFRGAKEAAFTELHIEQDRENWCEFSLRRNYRTDTRLLSAFDKSFSSWGVRSDQLLSFEPNQDKLIGSRSFNDYIKDPKKYYHHISIQNENERIPALIDEIQRIQRRIAYEEGKPQAVAPALRSIAILVRENWQADFIKQKCREVGIAVQTSTGGDLYMSQPALDMLTLVNTLVHFDEADYLYNLAVSNFFHVGIPKSNLHAIREEERLQWISKADEKKQANYLIDLMNKQLVNSESDTRWEHIVKGLRTKPVLNSLRELYRLLQPWKNYSDEESKQHYYQLNVDLLFEKLIDSCNVDRLTINTLQEQLYNSIVAQVSVDSRQAPSTHVSDEIPIQCITVHKSKGLEYGHVILPFCSASIDYMKPSLLQVSTEKNGGRVNIGYRMNLGDGETIENSYYNETEEKAEKSREETRILYVAMTRAVRSFSWIDLQGSKGLTWQSLIEEV